jgi:hypothetical protein
MTRRKLILWLAIGIPVAVIVVVGSVAFIVRGNAPSWVTRLRLSITGVGNWSFSDLHVTMEDIERYAPGIMLDVRTPDGDQVLVWAPRSGAR